MRTKNLYFQHLKSQFLIYFTIDSMIVLNNDNRHLHKMKSRDI